MTGNGMAWSLGGATVRGAAHVRRGQPNQDAVGWLCVPNGTAAHGFAAAISDGHGGAAYYRSDVGARLAVETAMAVLVRFLEAPPPQAGARAVAAEVLAAWRQAVMHDLAGNPIASEGDWVESEQEKLLPYGATLAAVAIGPDRLIALQIGDGDMLFGYPDGRVVRPLPDDKGLVGEQTYSLCLDDAATRFRVWESRPDAGQPWPDFVMLSTDGVAKSFSDEATFQSIAREYRASIRKLGLNGVLAQLEKWLNDVTVRGSGDDVTLCLAVGAQVSLPDAPGTVQTLGQGPPVWT
ncbi:MAG TPA: PP2C family serine/threonine-protein phosphatase [Vineibacter sp.]|nr:PP2C family serine/threonine-protein phosphatase [Vineibacter sp.]